MLFFWYFCLLLGLFFDICWLFGLFFGILFVISFVFWYLFVVWFVFWYFCLLFGWLFAFWYCLAFFWYVFFCSIGVLLCGLLYYLVFWFLVCTVWLFCCVFGFVFCVSCACLRKHVCCKWTFSSVCWKHVWFPVFSVCFFCWCCLLGSVSIFMLFVVYGCFVVFCCGICFVTWYDVDKGPLSKTTVYVLLSSRVDLVSMGEMFLQTFAK